uniref:Uncharacterized protein n=1 Tax=Triticum urartu TaxID=4572 RepID=A0A8R7U7K5_TRIUA
MHENHVETKRLKWALSACVNCSICMYKIICSQESSCKKHAPATVQFRLKTCRLFCQRN